MPKKKSAGLKWTEPPVIAPIPSMGKVRPFEKREPVPWPLTRPLEETAAQLVRLMNVPPEDSTITSTQLRWAVEYYADRGALPPIEAWPEASRNVGRAALDGFRFYWTDAGRLHWGYFGPKLGPSRLTVEAYWWLALAVLQAHEMPILRCAACQRFFADVNRRGKTVCSPACGNRLRYRERMKDPKLRSRYRKHQKEIMRARRAAGLA